MQKSNIISGGIFAALAAAFMIGAMKYGIKSASSDGVPGPGFFPFVLGLIVFVLGIILIVQGVTGKGTAGSAFAMDEEQRANIKTFFLTIGAIIAMFVIWHFPAPEFMIVRKLTMFEPAALFLCIALNKIYKRGWLFSTVFALFVVILIHLLFVQLLSISFEL